MDRVRLERIISDVCVCVCVCVASIGGEEDGGEIYGSYMDILI